MSQEPFKVLLKRGEFVDESRHNDDGSVRVVPFKVYHPVDHGLANMPVIIWSHGFGGNRDGASFISRHLAGLGYVIVHVTHHGTDSSLWEGKPGHPWDILQAAKISRETTINRFLDIPFALDSLKDWAAENPDIGGVMDFNRVGMSGHSFGAMTTQAMAGLVFPDADGTLRSYHEPRFKAGILYSPVTLAHLTDADPADIYGGIAIPLLHMTGTDDASPLEGYDDTHRLVVHEHAGHGEQYLQVLEQGDHMVYNGTRGKLGANPNREVHEAQILKAVTLFWDAYLKDDADARAGLSAYAS
jgi:dienelactone hydrolase